MPRRTFDEVMIVNPYDAGSNQGGTTVRFAYVPHPGYAQAPADAYGYYAEPYEVGYAEADPYGEYVDVAEYVDAYGNSYGYAEVPEMVGYDEYDPQGYAEYEPMPGYAEYEPAYAEYEPAYAEYEPVPGYAEYEPAPGYAEYEPAPAYAEYDPVEGYAEYEPVEGYAEYDPSYAASGYAEYDPAYGQPADMAGYVASRPPSANPTVLLSTNVNGLGDPADLAAYQTPSVLSPTVTAFTAPKPHAGPVPDQFRSLW
jgi:hypothetical protein